MQNLYSDESFRSRNLSPAGIHATSVRWQISNMKEKSLTPEEIALNCHTLRFVRPWMKLRGMSQRQIAEHLGMSEPSVSKWLNGKVNMSLSQFVRVAELLGATPEQLLFDPRETHKSDRYREAADLAENLDEAAFSAWINAGKAMRKND